MGSSRVISQPYRILMKRSSMALINSLGWPFLAVMFLVYGLCCIITIFFAFFLERYERIEERLDFSLLSAHIVTPLDIPNNFMDCWAKQHNRVVGVTLSLFSIFIIAFFVRILIS
jgi:hypothetical protein